MQCGRTKVSSIRPHKRFYFWVDEDLVEQLLVKERTIQFTSKDWSQVDDLFRVVGELDAQCVRSHDFNSSNLINRMIHAGILPSRTKARNKWPARKLIADRSARNHSARPVREGYASIYGRTDHPAIPR